MSAEFEELLENICNSPTQYEVLRYGKFLSDTEQTEEDGLYRLRIIYYDGELYKHLMRNGKCIKFSKV